MVKRHSPAGVYKHVTDPDSGEVTLVQDETAVSFEFSSGEVEQWARDGKMPRDLAESHLKKIDEHVSLMRTVRERFGPNYTSDQFVEVLREMRANFTQDDLDREIKDTVAFQDFLEKNWDRLSGVVDAAQKIRQSRDFVDNKFPSELAISNSSGKGGELSTQPLQLAEAEDKLVFTLCQLLAKKSERWDESSSGFYLGNHPPGEYKLDGERVSTARLLISPYELAREYYGRTDFGKDNLDHLLNTATELAGKRFHFALTQEVPQAPGKRGRPTFNRIRAQMPLFELVLVDENLTEVERDTISGDAVHETKTKLLFRLNPIFTRSIAKRFIEFPVDLHIRMARTKAAGRKGRVGEHTNLMRDYLMRELSACRAGNRPKSESGNFTIERNEDKLVTILGLDTEWRQGRKSRVRGYIQKSASIFTEIGLVVRLDEAEGSKGQRKYVFHLNPDFK